MLNKLRNAMIGRNGLDSLSIALIVFSLLLNTLSRFSIILYLFSIAIFAYAVWRVFSKNLAKRRNENYRFTKIVADIRDSYKEWKFRKQQSKQYKFFTCKECSSRLRVPRGKGKVNITCPKCGQRFRGKT